MSSNVSEAVVDSSPLMCILKQEVACQLFEAELTKTPTLYMSAPTVAEVRLAAMAAKGTSGLNLMNQLIALLNIKVIDFTVNDLNDYQNAASKYHLKATPPGLLNMGDIFSFILAQQLNLPLYFQGLDFLQTPVKNAMAILGYEMNADNRGGALH